MSDLEVELEEVVEAFDEHIEEKYGISLLEYSVILMFHNMGFSAWDMCSDPNLLAESYIRYDTIVKVLEDYKENPEVFSLGDFEVKHIVE